MRGGGKRTYKFLIEKFRYFNQSTLMGRVGKDTIIFVMRKSLKFPSTYMNGERRKRNF